MHSLRIASLAVGALLAIGAVGATTAQGANFRTESGEGTTITGAYPAGETSSSEEETFIFHTNGGAVSPCSKASFHGAMSTETQSTLTLTPTFGSCIFAVTMGSCQFTLGASGGFSIGGVNCATKPIEINRGVCKISIGPQENPGGAISYVNKGSGVERIVKATFNITGIDYTQTAGIPCPGGPGLYFNGKLTGIATLSADQPFEHTLKPKGLWVE